MLDDFLSASTDRAEALNEAYGALDAPDLIAAALVEPEIGSAALVSSFGAESVVLLHMVAQIAPEMPVLFLDTQMLFAETLDYQKSVAAELGLQNVRRILPAPADVAAQDPKDDLHQTAPDNCCALRKTAPLQEALRPFDTWITGRKRFQSATRAGLNYFEADGARLKINPLAYWSANQIAAYMDRHALPRHPLVSKGYRSLGCAPCTKPTTSDQDPRDGRWIGQDKVECGIHFENGRVVRPLSQGLSQ
jgi:phosphoadenosine phosphosulfate reductase